MFNPEQIIETFAASYDAVKRETAGLTHADSLLQPPFRENCLNWVLGHIVASRDNVLRTIDGEPVLAEAEFARYRNGSEPVTGDGPDVVRLERLLQCLDLTQERIAATLRRATPEILSREVRVGQRTMTAAGAVLYRLRHDAYHAGQVEFLRAFVKDAGAS